MHPCYNADITTLAPCSSMQQAVCTSATDTLQHLLVALVVQHLQNGGPADGDDSCQALDSTYANNK